MDSPENRPRADSWNPHIFSLACGSLRIPVGPSQTVTKLWRISRETIKNGTFKVSRDFPIDKPKSLH